MPSPKWDIYFCNAFNHALKDYEQGYETAIVVYSQASFQASALVETADREATKLEMFIASLRFWAKQGLDPKSLPAARDFVQTNVPERRLLEAEIEGFYHFQAPDWNAYIARDDRDPKHPKGVVAVLYHERHRPDDLKKALENADLS